LLSLQDAVILGTLSLFEKTLYQALLFAPVLCTSDNRICFWFMGLFYRMNAFKDSSTELVQISSF
jgi:hypothetical protein